LLNFILNLKNGTENNLNDNQDVEGLDAQDGEEDENGDDNNCCFYFRPFTHHLC